MSVLNWAELERTIEGEVAVRGSPAHAAVRPAFNARFHDVTPEAIVSCTSARDAAEAVSFARRHDLHVAMRNGGHSFAGHSSTQGLVIDVTPIRSVSVTDDVATVGAGARLGDVYEALQDHGLAIPAGTCPSVGVAGLTLGGGLGILGRTYGVTSDRLVRAEIVLADGRVLSCDEHHDQGLFWALRGAGAGTLGVVTSFTFRAVPAPDVTNVHLSWPFSRAGAVVEAWQGWAPNAPDAVAASLKVTATDEPDRPASVDVYAAVIDGAADVTPLLDDLVARAGTDPASSFRERMSFVRSRRFWAALGETDAPPRNADTVEPVWLYARSEFFGRPLPGEAVAALLGTFARNRRAGESRELDFMPWGGAYNRVPTDATAFVHRDELFQLKHAVVVAPGASAEAKAAARQQVDRSWASVHPWGSGRVFQNFAEPGLPPLGEAYHGSNLDRLMKVKERYDATNVFRLDRSQRPR